MNYIKSLILFSVVVLGFSSCSLFSPSHTRCSAYGADTKQIDDNQNEVHALSEIKSAESM